MFNRFIYELSLSIPNLAFFDAHFILMNSHLSKRLGNVIDLDDRRGVHITWGARKLITDNLVKAIDLTSHLSSGKSLSVNLENWHWPLRLDFMRIDR